MTLLAPLAAIIGGVVALPVLLALYFLKLRRRPVRVSSTLLWDEASADLQVNVPWRMIRASLLLLLHVLILACLVLAIGRPAVEGAWPTAARIFLVIDASASMSISDREDGVTRLDLARQRAVELAERYTEAPQRPPVTVIRSAAGARVVAPPSSDFGQVRIAIESIEPTDQPGDPGAALDLIASLSVGDARESDAAGGAGDPSVLAVLLSDGGDFERPPAVPGVRVVHEPVGEPGVARNVGVTAVSAARDYDDPGMLRVFARLSSSRPVPVAVPVAVTRDDEVLAEQAVRVPRATADGPGEASVTLGLRDVRGGPISVGFDRPDALGSDDRAFLVVPPARRPAVLVVGPGGGADAFLMDVLGAMSLSTVREIDAGAYAAATVQQLERYDVVIFDGVTPARLPGAPSLSFGATLPGIGDADAPERGGTTRVLSWDRRDPLARESRLGELLVGRRVALPDAGGAAAPGVREIARGGDGPLILAIAGPTARVVVGFRVVQSNWALDYGFPIFLASAIEMLASSGSGQPEAAWYRADEPASAAIDSGDRTVRVTGPVERTLTPTPAERASGRVSLGTLPRAGLYAVNGRFPVAVNTADTGESAGAVKRFGEGGEAGRGGTVRERGVRELWHWFVLGAIALLTLEWLAFARRSGV